MVFHQAVKSCPDPKPLRVGGLPGAKQAAEKACFIYWRIKNMAQGLKPGLYFCRVCGTTEVVPFRTPTSGWGFSAACKAPSDRWQGLKPSLGG
jgi:hypothetical protein